MKELISSIGKKGLVYLDGLKVEVEILDVKSSYGNTRYLIKPVAGEGEVWKEQITITE
jgi:hypothetical protein